MKRVRKQEFRIPPPNDNCEVFRWQKTGGGDLHIANHIIKPNEKFWAARESLPQGFLNTIAPLSELPDEKQKVEEKPEDLGYEIQSRGGSWYDIVDKNGKRLNEKALHLDEANKILAEL